LARNADLAGTVSDTGNGRVNVARALTDTSTTEVVPVGTNGALSGGPFVGPYVAAAFNATLQGLSKGSSTWINGPLLNWSEGDLIPTRVLLTGAAVTGKVIKVNFDHTKTTGGGTFQGINDLSAFTTSPNVTITAGPTLSAPPGSDTWSYTFTVDVTNASDGFVEFRSQLSAGAHYFTGASLGLAGTPSLGTLQITKPSAVAGSPDLKVTKTGPGTATTSSTITYTLSYQNKATSATPSTGTQLKDVLPSQLTYVSGSCTPTCLVQGSTITWDLGTLAVGAGGARSYQATVASGLATLSTFANSASILSAENDFNTADNTTSVTTTISSPSVSGTIFNDENGDGVFTPGELGMSGVSVTAKVGTTTVQTTTTDGNGNYSFKGLTAGTIYTLDYTASGFVATSPKPLSVTAVANVALANQNFFAQQRNASSPQSASSTSAIRELVVGSHPGNSMPAALRIRLRPPSHPTR